MKRLDPYHEKRDFLRSPEPRGRVKKRAPAALRYVVQKHAARRLHYDFRLELDGVLKSWAVPKGPSFEPGEKRLAVEVEDHPIEYGRFEGVIPKGEYGAGVVEIWDEGDWEPLDDPRRGLRKGHLRFRLRGRVLSGEWSLVRMATKDAKPNWLLIRSRDAAPPAAEPPPVELQLATLVDRVPAGEAWIHEIKLDGYRALARLEGRDVTLFTRSGQDWTRKFAPVARALAKLGRRGTFLDGEIVVLDADGRSSFTGLQKALSGGHSERLVYFAFDLLLLDGRDLRERPLLERKAALETLLTDLDDAGPLRYTDHLRGSGDAFHQEVCRMSLEGVVSKRADAPYRGGRGLDWVKTKCTRQQEFVVGGWTDPKGSRNGFGSLLLGVQRPDGLSYVGRVGSGFGDVRLSELTRRLAALARKDSPFADGPSRGAHWTEPTLVASVRFSGWTHDHRLRHPVFEGLREDKPAKDVVEEAPRTSPDRLPSRVEGVAITHPERVVYPEAGLRKIDLALYYASVAERMLPYLEGRPLSLVRCPDTRESCFYQKNWERKGEGVRDGAINYAVVRDARGLIALIQNGVLELHPWGARAKALENPDLLIFDLDPGPDVPWPRVVETARALRKRLRELDLESFAKTSGGKGLHVVAPISGKTGWEPFKAFAGAIAKEFAARHPELYTATMTKSARPGKVFIDWFRNGRGATAVAAWSVRARPHAPIAAPLSWNELARLSGADAYRVGRTPSKDPWTGFLDLKQRLPRGRA